MKSGKNFLQNYVYWKNLNFDLVRNLYFFIIGKKIIITHGFRKKTQKTPPEEIAKAKNYREDYKKRHPENGGTK